jgi:hypothetical protein
VIAGATKVRRVKETEFVRAIVDWLEGAEWPFDDARFAPYHGLSIRLRHEGDTLAMGGVPIISRSPPQLLRLPLDKPKDATARSEARGLCASALSRYAARSDGKPILPAKEAVLNAA